MSFTDNATKSITGGVNAGTVTEGHCLRVGHATDFEDSPVASREVTISQAALLTLRATPVTLVPAPGAGKVLQLISAQLQLVYSGTGNNTESTANLGIKYDSGSGVQVNETVEATGFIDQTADTYTTARPKLDPIVAATGATNKALVLHNLGAGEYGVTGGTPTSQLLVKIVYAVHNASA
jgi:hypothetical protein